MRNIVLIGFMGAGKTTVARLLAKKSGYTFADLDTMLEEKEKRSIPEIFAEVGEDGFRKLEQEFLHSQVITGKDHTIYSTGGGIVMNPMNRVSLKDLGFVVWLTITPETVLARLKNDTTRPLLQGDNKEEKVRDLLALRALFYEEASDFKVAVDKDSPNEIVDQIIAEYKKRGLA